MSEQLARCRVDPSTRRFGPAGRLVLGGSPRRLVRLSDAGASLLDRIGAGEALSASAGRVAVLDRLVRAGILQPDPVAGSAPSSAEDVTVVVPVRDDPDGVGALLRSLRAAGPLPARVVVVDDGSADPALLHRAVHDAGGSLQVELVRRDRSGGPAAARNAGIARVDTALVALLDADCVVGSDWLEPLLAQLADDGVAIVAPRVVAPRATAPHVSAARGTSARRDGSSSRRERYESACSPLDLGRRAGEVRPGARLTYVPSAALLARRQVLGTLGGFDESMRVGEDVDLVWRAVDGGHRVRYEPSALVVHRIRPTWSAWARQRVGYGRSAASLDERHPGQVAPAVCSWWSLALWSLALAGHPLAATSVGAATTAALARSLEGLPLAEVARLGASGHLSAGRQLACAALRVWWPLLLVGSIVSRRVRRVAMGCAAISAAGAWSDASDRTRVDLAPWELAAISLVDDAAYGAGVWQGCWRRRSWRALLPRLG
ncbi:MAG: mycofactocin biosynthesis glycosyltransferase MftF [Microthrixaceae bacterium]